MPNSQTLASAPKRWTPRVLTGSAAASADLSPSKPSAEVQLLQALMQQRDQDDFGQVMAETTLQLQRLSGWRWAVVARLVDDGNAAQMLALVDRGKRLAGHTYHMALSPCATLALTHEVRHIDQVMDRFAEEALLREMGVLHYAGLVCRRGDQPIGHVFLMHDQALTDKQARQIDPLLQLSAMHVGGRLELAGVRSVLRDVQRQAETDSLTQLPNRHAFERELALQQSLVDQGARDDSLLAIFDVNGLKLVNDAQGHLAGDALLRRVADALRGQLRRQQDQVFRIGGDEFALLTDGPKAGCANWLFERSQEITRELQANGFPQAGLSMGSARLREAGGDRGSWLALADARMYAHKGSRRRA